MNSIWRLAGSGLTCVLPMSLILLSYAGCSDAKVMVAVSGSVIAKGQPVAGALVMFLPQSDPIGLTASGVTAEDGKFVLSSGVDKGIAPGTYRVTITWPDPSVKPTEAEMMMGMMEQGPDLLKGAYATADASKLTAEITTSSAELPPFDIEVP